MPEDDRLPLMHVYCDESSQTKNKYMVIGGIWIPEPNVKKIDDEILDFRNTSGMSNELKWGKVSKGKLNEYKQFVDIVFSYLVKRHLVYRCIVVNMWDYDINKFSNGDSELGFYKIYYQLLLQNYLNGYRYIVYPDDRQNSYKHRLEALKIILNRGIKKKYNVEANPIRAIEARKSHEVNLIQAVDLFTGAIGYKWNKMDFKPDASAAKIELAQYIAYKANLSTLMICHNKQQSPNFHIWYFDLSKSHKNKKSKING